MLEIMLFVALLVAVILWIYLGEELPRKYKARKCAGKKWKQNFPNAGKEEIRSFLLLFVDAFAFHPKNKLQFEPDDKLLEIYAELYPSPISSDSMEFECLSESINEYCGLSLDSVWNDHMTLGGLFTCVRETGIAGSTIRG